MSRPLFRKEALDAQRDKFLGELTVARPLPLWVFTLLAAAIAAAVIAVAVWGQYQRRERVQGFLASQIGSVPMLISDAGQVKEIEVAEGDEVVAGQPLARVTIDRTTSSAASSSDTVLVEIGRRRAILEQERDETLALGDREVDQVHKRIADLRNEIAALDSEVALQRQRLKSAHDVELRYEGLAKDHFISDVGVQQKRDDVTDQELKLATLGRERASLEKDLGSAQLDEPALRLKTTTQVKQIARQMSELAQSSAEETLLGETVIRAPIAGTITNINVSQGQIVAADTPLATIIPTDNRLHVELLVPTRAIGFVHAGQLVQLRYEAFPYERFGQYKGVVESVGKTAWMQGEHLGPVAIREPAYRIIVKLDRQTVRSGNQDLALRPGMLVSADLLMEKRTLLEWLFQPLLQLRERIR
ncbi:MAG: HlyD family efflux transporter periplasmic adaptor subunit [Burkholderiaceae bacterium]|jgi:membrane fusion protein